MAYLVDTNVLVRWVNRLDPDHQVADAALQRLHARREALYVGAQTLIELWGVATRPLVHNGLGRSPAQARRLVDGVRRLLPLLPDDDRVFDQWLLLATTGGVSGRQVHDARIAALMVVHDVMQLLTFNGVDFVRYQQFGVVAVHPGSV